MLVFLAFGIIFLFIGTMSANAINSYCGGQTANTRFQYIADEISYIDGNITDWPKKYFCTESCPCPAATVGTVNTTNDWLTQFDQDTLVKNGRTKYDIPNRSDLKIINRTNSTGPVVTKNYMDFYSCYNDVINRNSDVSTTTNTTTKYQAGLVKLENGLIDFLRNVENEFKCSGICNPGPFYWFSDVWAGMPTSNCILAVKDTFRKRPLAIGIILLVTFFITLLTWITHFSMCCGKASKKD